MHKSFVSFHCVASEFYKYFWMFTLLFGEGKHFIRVLWPFPIGLHHEPSRVLLSNA